MELTDSTLPTFTHGGKRERAGARPKKVDQADHYTRLAKAKADHEEQKAVLAKLEREQREGTLMPADQVLSKWQERVTSARARLLALPSKLAGACFGRSEADIEETARVIIHEALDELAGR